VHPDPAAGELAEPAGQLVQRDVQGALDPRGPPFGVTANVEQDRGRPAAGLLEGGEIRDRVGAAARRLSNTWVMATARSAATASTRSKSRCGSITMAAVPSVAR
jgi:hypothetical protein